MLQDKLTQDQRIRLEAIAQAIVSLGAQVGRPVDDRRLTERATVLADFIRGDDNGTDQTDR